jgi:hypothetical protein
MEIIGKIKEHLNDRINTLKDSVKVEDSGAFHECKEVLEYISKLEEEYTPQHSYYEQIYHVGKEPRWCVGDKLAYYLFTQDEEGEFTLDVVTNVEKGVDDWVYTLDGDDEDLYTESELISYETYRKNNIKLQ